MAQRCVHCLASVVSDSLAVVDGVALLPVDRLALSIRLGGDFGRALLLLVGHALLLVQRLAFGLVDCLANRLVLRDVIGLTLFLVDDIATLDLANVALPVLDGGARLLRDLIAHLLALGFVEAQRT